MFTDKGDPIRHQHVLFRCANIPASCVEASTTGRHDAAVMIQQSISSAAKRSEVIGDEAALTAVLRVCAK